MELSSLLPESPEFKLKATGEHVHRIRLPNLEDRVAIVKLCGGEAGVNEVFREQKWTEICRIVYRLLEDRSPFPMKEESGLNEEGIEERRIVVGPIVLQRALSTRMEAINMLNALTCAFTASEPELREYIEAELKKKMKDPEPPSTGPKSSMP